MSFGPEIKVPKGGHNPYGSTTGPYHTIGGWGLLAEEGKDPCPKCGGLEFHYVPGFAEAEPTSAPAGTVSSSSSSMFL